MAVMFCACGSSLSTAVQRAFVNQWPILFVDVDVTAEAFFILLGGLQWIEFYAEMAKEGGNTAEMDIGNPACGVALFRANMRTHNFRWEKIAKTALDGEAFQRIIIV